MKKILILASVVLAVGILPSDAQSTRTLKKVMSLPIPMEGGANGASVTWHPLLKKYYASMAGNTNFSLAVYDAMGKRISADSQRTMFDVRALWYNPATRTIQMNGYADYGWAEYKLNAKGIPVDVKVLHDERNQPTDQSAGAYDPVRKHLYFLNEDGNIDRYDASDATLLETVELHLGRKTENDEGENEDVIDDYNNSTVVYTGVKGSEIGLLNYTNMEIELYDIQTGFLTKKLSLPSEVKAPDAHWLNFAYANGIYWLFNTETRTWEGYK